jgi:carbon starvation protein
MISPIYKPLSKGTYLPGVIITSFIVSFSWYYLLKGGTVSTIWPMFGIANQLLSVIALAIGTTYIMIHSAKKAYALTTFVPFCFLAVTIMTAGIQYTAGVLGGPDADYLKGTLTIIMMVLAVVVSVECISKWIKMLKGKGGGEEKPGRDLMALAEGIDIND